MNELKQPSFFFKPTYLIKSSSKVISCSLVLIIKQNWIKLSLKGSFQIEKKSNSLSMPERNTSQTLHHTVTYLRTWMTSWAVFSFSLFCALILTLIKLIRPVLTARLRQKTHSCDMRIVAVYSGCIYSRGTDFLPLMNERIHMYGPIITHIINVC